MDFLQYQESPGKVEDALEYIPQDPDDFYGKSLDRVNGGKSDSAKKVIGWILLAKRQLKVAELEEAIALSSTSPGKDYRKYVVKGEDMLKGCEGLVIYEHETQVVKFAHLTVHKYLRDRVKDGKLFDGHIEEMIATTCIRYLSLGAFAAGACPTDEDFEARLQSQALYDYAAQN
jgi:hypothetical protein